MRIRSQLIREGGRIPFRVFREGGREHYHVRIFVDASAEVLNTIESVEYQLHPSFKSRVRRSSDRESRFAIEIWTWGLFEADAVVRFSDGAERAVTFAVDYSLPPDDGTNYLQE